MAGFFGRRSMAHMTTDERMVGLRVAGCLAVVLVLVLIGVAVWVFAGDRPAEERELILIYAGTFAVIAAIIYAGIWLWKRLL